MIEYLSNKINDNYDSFAYIQPGKDYSVEPNGEFKAMLEQEQRVNEPVPAEEVSGETEIELYVKEDTPAGSEDSSIKTGAESEEAAKEGKGSSEGAEESLAKDRLAAAAKKGEGKGTKGDLLLTASLLNQANVAGQLGVEAEGKVKQGSFKLKIKELPLEVRGEAKKLVGDLKKGLISNEEFRVNFAALMDRAVKKDSKFAGKLALRAKESGLAGAAKVELRVAGAKGRAELGDSISLKGESLLNKEAASSLESLKSGVDNSKANSELKEPALKGGKSGLEKRAKLNSEAQAIGEKVELKADSLQTKEFSLELLEPKDGANVAAKERSADLPKLLNSNRDRMFDHIAKTTKVIMNNSETTFSTMIRPDEVGRIDVKFNIKDGKIAGRIILQNQEAADFFRANVEELRAVFQKANVEMEALDIRVAGQGSGASGGEQFGAGEQGEESFEGGKAHFSQKVALFEENNVNDETLYRAGHHGAVNISV